MIVDVCTIIAKNYVAYARVLARSLADHNPGSRLAVLVVDETDGYIEPEAEPFRLLTPEQIGCAPFPGMAARYTVLELCTAVKPWLLRFLLDEGSPAVTYLDPDIRIYSSLARLDELARKHPIVLIPHNRDPIAEDGELPNQLAILQSGVYNLGYLGISRSPETDWLIEWWAQRLERDCRVKPRDGFFVDQRWFDLVPGFVSDCAIVRDAQYDVAYWNLAERQLASGADGYEVDGEPLGFFHFSGFDPHEPQLLSRFQTRVKLSEDPALAALCREYVDAVMEDGFADTSSWPYTYGALPDGTPFTHGVRILYERALDAGELAESPFTQSGYEQLLRSLAVWPSGAPSGFNRLLAYAYSEHPELRAGFPDAAGSDYERLVEFAKTTTKYDLGPIAALDQRGLLTPPHEPDAVRRPRRQLTATPWGVNAVGFFHSDLGPGIAARAVVAALDAAEIPVLPGEARGVPDERERHPFACVSPATASLAVNLLCVAPTALPELAGALGEAFFAGRHSIALWLSEAGRYPERLQYSFDLVEELWVPTRYLAEAFATVAPMPVSRVIVPLLPEPAAQMPRGQLGLPDGFLFLSSIDHAGLFEAQNPLGLVEAFKIAFSPGEGASLVIQCLNERSAMADHEQLKLAAGGHDDIHVMAGYLPRARQRALVAACDCYASLHRATGFGLAIAEAMYLGKPAIATRYSGNLDFMTDANSLLVDHELVDVTTPPDMSTLAERWAEPSIEHAARLMRRVFDEREWAASLGRRGAADLRSSHSAARAGEVLAERLEPQLARWLARAGTNQSALRLGSRAVKLPDDPAHAAAPGGRSPRTLARRAVLRAIKPYTAPQDELNEAVRDALLQLQPELLRLDRRQAAIEARLDPAGSELPSDDVREG